MTTDTTARVSGTIKALETCPYCGHTAYTDHESMAIFGARTGHNYAVACRYCEASATGADTLEDAYANWNRRAPTAAIQPEPEPQPVACELIDREAVLAVFLSYLMGAGPFGSDQVIDALDCIRSIPPTPYSAGTVSVEAAARVLLYAQEDYFDGEGGHEALGSLDTEALRALAGERG